MLRDFQGGGGGRCIKYYLQGRYTNNKSRESVSLKGLICSQRKKISISPRRLCRPSTQLQPAATGHCTRATLSVCHRMPRPGFPAVDAVVMPAVRLARLFDTARYLVFNANHMPQEYLFHTKRKETVLSPELVR